jgi:hypothetical protein
MSNGPISRAIIAALGLNDGANKGFWRLQPRDDEGQWIEMGAEVLAVLRGLRGGKAGVTANYVGPSGVVGKARILVENDSDLPDGIYEIDSHLLTTLKAILPESFVDSKGLRKKKDKFGNDVSISEADIPDISEIAKTRTDITEEDRRLAKGELTPEERSAEALGREESPIAQLPGGFESLNREEAKQLLRDSGVEPDDFDPSAKKAPLVSGRAEKPAAYGFQNLNDFKRLPDGTVLDQYERAQYYPNPDGFDGPFGDVRRQIIKQDGQWFAVGKNGKAVGKPFNSKVLSAYMNSGNLADAGAGSKIDENGNKAAAWADEVDGADATPEISDTAGAPEKSYDDMSTLELGKVLEGLDTSNPEEKEIFMDIGKKLFG